MTPSQKCYDLIKSMEGLKLTAYVDPGSGNLPITIGYGSTMRPTGIRFQLGDKITLDEAEKTLEWEVNNKAKVVASFLEKILITQSQFDALVSFTYNVGVGNFKDSTLLKKIKINPDDETIAFEFSRWNKASGKILQGLVNRRIAEYKLYQST